MTTALADPPSILEIRISLRVQNERLADVLRKISTQGGFSFSYSPDAIAVDSRVSLDETNRSVRELLNILFDGTVIFKERRRYIILQKATTASEKKPEIFYLNGYVTDLATGERLPDASIYEPVTLASTVTNRYGYYKIKLPVDPKNITLEVRKEEYTGRSVEVLTRKNTFLSFSLALAPSEVVATPQETPRDSIRIVYTPKARPAILSDSARGTLELPGVVVISDTPRDNASVPSFASSKTPIPLEAALQKFRNGLVYAFSTARQAIHVENIEDSLHRSFQASLLPFIGTNQQLSGNVVNDVSVNLVAGYSLGVDLLEVGAGLNLVRHDVNGLQMAGLGNVVGRNVRGVQLAGLTNLVIGDANGFQAAAAINITAGSFRGVQLGAMNVTGGALEGWQIGTGINVARNVRSGHQVGIVNYADSSATVPFGYFSFVRKNGYRRFELSTNELQYGNVTFKTGVRKFYNIFTIGTSALLPNKPLGSIGYGLGTARYLGRRSRGDARKWMLNLDFVASRVALERRFLKAPHAIHTRLSLDLERKIGPRLSVTVGPSLNLFFSPYQNLITEGSGLSNPLQTTFQSTGEGSIHGWVGFNLGLRFCNRLL